MQREKINDFLCSREFYTVQFTQSRRVCISCACWSKSQNKRHGKAGNFTVQRLGTVYLIGAAGAGWIRRQTVCVSGQAGERSVRIGSSACRRGRTEATERRRNGERRARTGSRRRLRHHTSSSPQA